MFSATSIAGFPLTRHTSDNGVVCALKGLFFFIFVHLFIHIHCLAKLNKIECLLILFDPKIGFSNG